MRTIVDGCSAPKKEDPGIADFRARKQVYLAHLRDFEDSIRVSLCDSRSNRGARQPTHLERALLNAGVVIVSIQILADAVPMQVAVAASDDGWAVRWGGMKPTARGGRIHCTGPRRTSTRRLWRPELPADGRVQVAVLANALRELVGPSDHEAARCNGS